MELKDFGYLVYNHVIHSIAHGDGFESSHSKCYCISCFEKLKPIQKNKLHMSQINWDDVETHACDICHTLLKDTEGTTCQRFFENVKADENPNPEIISRFSGLNIKVINNTIPILLPDPKIIHPEGFEKTQGGLLLKL